nr:malonyl-ACP O-methyltransferase BioC [Microbulbifer guangxiensis]
MLHGWGCDGRLWAPLQAELEKRLALPVSVLELPGFGARHREAWPETSALLDELNERIPAGSLLMGHSLGGMLAVRLAARSDRVAGVITLAANARFTAAPGWPGMAPSVFEAFYHSFAQSGEKTWLRFCGLQVQGDRNARALLKQLRGLAPEAMGDAWVSALRCLGQLDNRETLQQLEKPQLHLLAEGDALVPADSADALNSLGVPTEVISAAGHVLPLGQPRLLGATIEQFVRAHTADQSAAEVAEPFAKQAVARSFGRAAADYDAAAHLQRAVCRHLLASLPEGTEPRRILDLGSGTGYGSELLRQRFPFAEIIALDLAEGMLAYARERRPAADGYIAADAEQLPLADDSFDLVFSSMALQWCYRLPQLFAELQRVVAPGGRLLVSTLGPGTLRELKAAWASVDDGVHVNRFLSADEWSAAARAAGLGGIRGVEERVLHYATAVELMRDLKRIGAHNVNRGAGRGLTGRDRLRRLSRAYEPWRTATGLPASYEVIYLDLHCTAHRGETTEQASGVDRTADAGTGAGVYELGS